MRPALLLSLLLISLLAEAQGIRLEQGFTSSGHQKIHEQKEVNLNKASDDSVREAALCKDGHCSGRSRKLMNKPLSTSTTSTTTTATLKSVKNNGETEIETTPERRPSDGVDGNNKNSPIKSSLVSEQGKVERYPDIMDLAGMDYSLAKRKSPIHN